MLRLGRAGGGRAVGVLSVWLGWERLTSWWWKPQVIRPGGVFRYRVVTYRGRPIALESGDVVRPGDRIVELHFDNRQLLHRVLAGGRLPWDLVRAARADVDELARRVANGELAQVRAVRGVTLFARAGRRLGFEVRPLRPSWSTRLLHYFFVGLVAVYHPEGWKAAQRYRARGWPGEAWMGRTRLLERATVVGVRSPVYPAPPCGSERTPL